MADSARRPLSPHLQIYRPQITSVLSIFHRLSGIALAGGLVFLVGWFLAAAVGPVWATCVAAAVNSTLGALVLFAFSGAFFFHACNGIRHLVWDAGWGFELGTVTLSGWLVLVVSVLLTLGLWASVLLV